MTGMVTKEEESRERLGLNVDGHHISVITKPIDQDALVKRVKKILAP